MDRLDRRAPPGHLAVPRGACRAGRGRVGWRRTWPACTCRSSTGRPVPGRSRASPPPMRGWAAPPTACSARVTSTSSTSSIWRPVSPLTAPCRCPSSRSPSTSSPDRRCTGLQLARGAGPRLGAWLYWRAIGRLQARICRKFERILTMSEHDRRTLLARDPALSVGVLPLPCGLDLARAQDVSAGPGRAAVRRRDVPRRQRGRGAVVPRRDPAARESRDRGGPLHDRRRVAARRDPASGGVARRSRSPASSNRSSRSTRARPCSWRRCGSPVASRARRSTRWPPAVPSSRPPSATTASGRRRASTCWSPTHRMTSRPPSRGCSVTPAQREQLGESARRFAVEHYAPAVSAAALEREHQALAGAPSTHQAISRLTILQ